MHRGFKPSLVIGFTTCLRFNLHTCTASRLKTAIIQTPILFCTEERHAHASHLVHTAHYLRVCHTFHYAVWSIAP